jgi:hypothetical protein
VKVNENGTVRANGVQPEILYAMLVTETVYLSMGYDFTITALTEGKEWRSPRSLHPPGLAFDCRTRHIPDRMLDELVARVKGALGPEYDVVLESDHLHIEFDME